MDPMMARVAHNLVATGYWSDASPAFFAAGDGHLLCHPGRIERRSDMRATLFLGPFHRPWGTQGDG